jgi:hypothetical protein
VKARYLSLATLLAALAAVVVSAAAASVAESFKLSSVGGSRVSGTATVSSPGDAAAARVSVTVRRLAPGAAVRIQLNAVERGRTGASTVVILTGRADAKGGFAGSGRIRYRGEPVTFASVADGAHAFSVVTGGRVVARGILPGMD